MVATTETTRVTLRFEERPPRLDRRTESRLRPVFDSLDLDLDGVCPIEGGLRFEAEGMCVTLTQATDRCDDLRIVAAGADDGLPGSAAARLRFRLCAALAREISATHPPRRMEFRHRGGVYVTEGGRTCIVSGMRGTSGLGRRRRAAARPDRRLVPPAKLVPPVSHGTPVVATLTQYTLTATIGVLSLPVGAALTTYCLFRGGSVQGAARWLACTGLGVGLMPPDLLERVTALL